MRAKRRYREELEDKDIEMLLQTLSSGKLILLDIIFLSFISLFFIIPPQSPLYYYPIVFACIFISAASLFAFIHWIFKKKA